MRYEGILIIPHFETGRLPRLSNLWRAKRRLQYYNMYYVYTCTKWKITRCHDTKASLDGWRPQILTYHSELSVEIYIVEDPIDL